MSDAPCLLQLTSLLSLLQCSLPGVDVAKMMLVQPEGNRPCEANHTDPYVLPSEKVWQCGMKASELLQHSIDMYGICTLCYRWSVSQCACVLQR